MSSVSGRTWTLEAGAGTVLARCSASDLAERPMVQDPNLLNRKG